MHDSHHAHSYVKGTKGFSLLRRELGVNDIAAMKAFVLAKSVRSDLVAQRARDPVHRQGMKRVIRIGKAFVQHLSGDTCCGPRKARHGQVAGCAGVLDDLLVLGVGEHFTSNRCLPVRIAGSVRHHRRAPVGVDRYVHAGLVYHLGVADRADPGTCKKVAPVHGQGKTGIVCVGGLRRLLGCGGWGDGWCFHRCRWLGDGRGRRGLGRACHRGLRAGLRAASHQEQGDNSEQKPRPFHLCLLAVLVGCWCDCLRAATCEPVSTEHAPSRWRGRVVRDYR